MSRAASAQALLDGKAKPLGSLGRIEALGVQLALLQDTDRPVVRDPVVVVFAGDHGSVASGVSAYPSAVTAAMVGIYLQGRAAINILARQAGARVLVVDAGVDADLPTHPDLLFHKIARGTANWVHGPAMKRDQVIMALERGAAVMTSLDSTVVGLGDMGIGNTSSAALVVHKVTGQGQMVGPGAGLDEAGLKQKRVLMIEAAKRTAPVLDPYEALAEYGGFEIAMLTGAILQAAKERKCVVIDGLLVTAAAVLAHRIAPECLEACVFAHRSAEPGHAAMLAGLGVEGLLDLGMRLGEGSGAALALPLLQAACSIMAGMADLADVV